MTVKTITTTNKKTMGMFESEDMDCMQILFSWVGDS